MVEARRPALEAADHDQVRKRPVALRLPAAAVEVAALGGEALARSRHHRVVGGVGASRAPLERSCGPDGSPAQPPAPSFFAASRKLRTSASGFLRPSSFSPRRLTQITGTFIFSTGAMSAS